MFVKDIIERPTSKPTEPGTAPTAPAPPKLPTAQARGFPAVAHRSQGTSSFARARKNNETRSAGGLATGEGRVVEAIPAVGSSSGMSVPSTAPLSEAEEVRRQVDAENAARVAAMSDAERQQEAEELKERFGSGLADLMRQRREARGGATATPPKSDTQKLLADIDAENRRRLEGMTAAEKEAEMQELEERFGATLLGRLKERAVAKQAGVKPPEAPVVKDAVKEEVEEQNPRRPSLKHKHSPPSSEPSSSKAVRFDTPEDTTPSALQKKYFPSEAVNNPNLEWMQGAAQKAEDPNAPRFDLSGAPLSAEKAASLPTHLGLHHHGASPDLAGYTIAEIVHLCYSTVAGQRITMMGVLGRLITRYRTADQQSDEPWIRACIEGDAVRKGIDVGSSVLGGHARSVGVLSAAVDLLYAALGGPEWTWLDDDCEFHPEPPTKDGEATGIAAIPFDDLAPRLAETLGMDFGGLPESTFNQLLRILRRAACTSPALADAVTPLVPPLLKSHVLRVPWPIDPSQPPSLEALHLLRDVVTSSRAASEALAGQSTFDPLLKFVATGVPAQPEGRALVVEVLKTLYALGRYGLCSGMATSAREIWSSLGAWIVEQTLCPDETFPGPCIVAYFDLIRIWTVCAIDPHRTTPDHDLKWSQISALGWIDEELAALRALVGSGHWLQIAAVLAAISDHLTGAAINGVRGGAGERAAVITALRDMDLIGSLPQGINEMPDYDARDDFNKAVTAIIGLHNQFAKAGEDFLVSPDRERLLWWFAATTQSTETDVYLRHAVLDAAARDKVLDTEKWATSAFDLALSFKPGDEPLALQLVDELLRTDWTSVHATDGIGHKDRLQILRPLLHHAVLPELENILGPRRPSFLYLKATGTLRSSPPPTNGSPRAGLPLADDWVFSPLNELLSSGTSQAFALAPPDWDATETQLVRATLTFARIAETTSPANTHRSLTLLNAMKVFMLEHGAPTSQAATSTQSESDVFRDSEVQASLKALLDSTSTASDYNPAPAPAPLEFIALPFLGAGVPFFQFYQDLVALFEAVSFGDVQFARVLLPPLAMTYPVDYRRLFWAESSALRSVRVEEDVVPLEAGTPEVYFSPKEDDKEVLSAYARALVTGLATGFLARVATHHLASFLWTSEEEEKTSHRVQLLIVLLAQAKDDVLRRVLEQDVESSDGKGVVAEEEVRRRVSEAARLTGPRGVGRLQASGYEVQ